VRAAKTQGSTPGRRVVLKGLRDPVKQHVREDVERLDAQVEADPVHVVGVLLRLLLPGELPRSRAELAPSGRRALATFCSFAPALKRGACRFTRVSSSADDRRKPPPTCRARRADAGMREADTGGRVTAAALTSRKVQSWHEHDLTPIRVRHPGPSLPEAMERVGDERRRTGDEPATSSPSLLARVVAEGASIFPATVADTRRLCAVIDAFRLIFGAAFGSWFRHDGRTVDRAWEVGK
jgi:hypothetical protein